MDVRLGHALLIVQNKPHAEGARQPDLFGNPPRRRGVMADDDKLIRSFVQGAQWWEYESTRGTMWHSDRDKAGQEAVKRTENRTLGEPSPASSEGEGETKP
jgi:hypothetical protein